MKKVFVSMMVMLSVLSTTIFADVQTLTLNTGFNHDTNQAYQLAAPLKDDFWTVVYDQANVTVRLSDLMAPYGGAWKPAMNNSQWIAFAPNGVPTANNKPQRVYVFQKCFCLKKGFDEEQNFKNTMLELNLRADDWAAVYLNENPATITATNPPNYPFLPPNALLAPTASSGGFSSPNPATFKMEGKELISRLRVGRNCLQVRLDDLGLVVSGFNLTGSLTAAGIDGVAKGANPKAQFNSCSSCSKIIKGDPKSLEMNTRQLN